MSSLTLLGKGRASTESMPSNVPRAHMCPLLPTFLHKFILSYYNEVGRNLTAEDFSPHVAWFCYQRWTDSPDTV
jgi:hypothetical protein